MSSSDTLYLIILRRSLSLNLAFCIWASLPGQWDPSIHLSLQSQHWVADPWPHHNFTRIGDLVLGPPVYTVVTLSRSPGLHGFKKTQMGPVYTWLHFIFQHLLNHVHHLSHAPDLDKSFPIPKWVIFLCLLSFHFENIIKKLLQCTALEASFSLPCARTRTHLWWPMWQQVVALYRWVASLMWMYHIYLTTWVVSTLGIFWIKFL